MRVVLDTNILVSGLLWNGAPARIVDRVDEGLDRLLISRALLQELAAVLTRPKFARIFQRFDEDPRDFIAAVAARAILIEPKPLASIVISADPSDDRVLACAATAEADYIVSGDRHLLKLTAFGSIPILAPGDYLHTVAGNKPRQNSSS